MRIYIDTNALIEAVEGQGEIADLVRRLLSDSRSVTFVSSQLTLGEMLVIPLRSRDIERSNAALALFAGEGPLEVFDIDRDVVIAAADLRASYQKLKWPDAIHLATAIEKECTHVLSNDHGLPKLPNLTFVRLQEASIHSLFAEIQNVP